MKAVGLLIRLALTAVIVAALTSVAMQSYSAVFGRGWSWEAFFGAGAILAAVNFVGGLMFGVPASAFAQRRGFADSELKMIVYGALIGALAAAILAFPFFEFRWPFAVVAAPYFAAVGAVSGAIAAPIWNRLGVLAKRYVQHG